MSLAIDTNIFIYSHVKNCAGHEKVTEALQNVMDQNSPFYISWQTYYEYLRMITHPSVFRPAATLMEGIMSFDCYLQHPQCHILSETRSHSEVVKELSKTVPFVKGNMVHDFHYAAILKEHGVKEILTCDMDFKKFDFLKVINPLNS